MTPLKDEQLRIRDIAKLANVSTGTVDRVLHGRPGVKQETKEEILKILEEINYIPNLMAKTLASKKTTRFVVLIPDSKDANSYWTQPVLGIHQAVEEISNFRTVIDLYTFDDSLEESFAEMTEKIINEEPDGVIFCPVFHKASQAFIKELKKLEIPFVFIDTDLKNSSNIAYFGQDAFKSGYLAGKLMSYGLKGSGELLILKQVNSLLISRHVENREKGFREFFESHDVSKNYKIFDLDIDLLDMTEPQKSLKTFFSRHKVEGIFVPNSRAFKLAQYMQKQDIKDTLVIGYDLIPDNIKYLESGIISFLIGQRPEEQAYKAIKSLFDYTVLNKEIKKLNYSPIDIITKENIGFYKEFRNE
ncbi:MAG: substrate-binding domain-containing protein [Bacteroidales bacterium]|nr:substrate-binding domain-containing protein [Bacteroidales bacterium]